MEPLLVASNLGGSGVIDSRAPARPFHGAGWIGLVLATLASLAHGQAQFRGFCGGRFDTRLLTEPFQRVWAGEQVTLFLRADGSITGVGNNLSRRLDYPAPPPGTHYVGLAAGNEYTLALRDDGVVIVRAGSFSPYAQVPVPASGVQHVALDGGYE